PLRELLTERALDVLTREAYHLLMPDHERLRGRIPGFGGGIGSSGGRFFNPFKRKSEPPFTHWAPLLKVGQSPSLYKVKVPEYFSGTVRVMAIGSAVDGGVLSAGSAETKVLARGGVILKPQLPLVVAPGDSFTGAVVVANTVEGSGKAKIHLDFKLDAGLNLQSPKKSVELLVAENTEEVVSLPIKVGDSLGAASLFISATMADGKTFKRSQSLSIRPASPLLTTERVVPLKDVPLEGSNYVLESNRELYVEQAKTTLGVASTEVLALRALLAKLDHYPYGCTEQLISRAMPYVVLWDQPKLRDLVLANPTRSLKEQLELGEKTMQEALLAIRQCSSYEGVSFWPLGPSSNLLTAYAADFLLSMKEHGLNPPADLFEQLFERLENVVTQTPKDVEDGREKIYAAWVLQRDGRIMTTVLTNLENWFSKNTKGWEKDVLSSLLSDSFATLRLRKRASERLPRGLVQVTNDPLFSTAVARSLHALILLKAEELEGLEGEVRSAIFDAALSPNANTMDLAMSSRALAEMAKAQRGSLKEVSAHCTEYASGFAETEKTVQGSELFLLEAPGCRRFAVKAAQSQGLALLLDEEGFDKKPKARDQKLELKKTLLVGEEKVKQVKLGQVVTAKICARSLGKSVDNVVLLDLVAGGLEPIIDFERVSSGSEQHSERREDRMLFFVNLTPEESCYSYKLRATTKGTFVVPGAAAEAMYQSELSGTSPSATLEVR
ncbi:MAG: hypothetical protein IJS50_03865, partial [Desulfovibrio sp.]|nr:hypothetical protein [Desulfovibrio sp.]